MAFGRLSRALSGLGAALACLAGAVPALADPPGRVVSINLCTDQLAMMLAAPGQLVSVSAISADPMSSPLSAEAAGYTLNHGGAEQIYLMRPDLVLAHVHTDPTVIAMLRRLGVPVAQFDGVRNLDEVAARVAQMGAALGREAAADDLIARFQADLAALGPVPSADAPRAAFYYPNGYSLGAGTLAHEILTAAGLRNIAEELRLDSGGRLALELLVLAAPDMVVSSQVYAGASRSEAILRHRAFRALTGEAGPFLSNADWVCGTPHVARALRDLRDARARLHRGDAR